ncbi:helix-turn-helix domain-containing protein [Niveispirillum fermenti]|uniref:helix-turn-helix domain-containing protein n=1 Tax=Niveispirillum fermenti TaxID=1233113 RepID=UPI003A88DAAF
MHHVGWSHCWEAEGAAIILPDGCRDLLVTTGPDGRQRVSLTDWDTGPRAVRVAAGTQMAGFRLRPGMVPDPLLLRRVVAAAQTRGEAAGIGALLESGVAADREMEQVIDALAQSCGTGAEVARQAGVVPRTLQRRLAGLGLPPPDFWRLLGRARRAAASLGPDRSLADIACAFGYSDQAHMTREFTRWFGLTPARLSRRRAELGLLAQPGLGNWTGEQISMR